MQRAELFVKETSKDAIKADDVVKYVCGLLEANRF